jgi:hemolysin activation/secretion protein
MLVFAQDQDVPIVRFIVSEFSIEGKNPLTPEVTEDILAPFLGEHEGLDGLLEAAAELESAILNAGHSFHRVTLPPQTLDAGRVELQVMIFTLANIEVSDSEYFSDENIIRSLPGLKPGTTPNTRELSRQLIVANDHPSKQVTIRIKQSEVPDSVDAVLEVQDRRPWQFFSVLNNIGTTETGRLRFSVGYQHSNLFDLDDTMTMSYTTSPGHTSDVKQWGVNYRLPIYPVSGSISLFYSRSDVDSGQVEQVFDVSGAGQFFGGHFTHTLLNFKNYRHRATVGVEDKLFNNDVSFIGALIGVPIGVDVRSRPLSLSYSGEYRKERSNLNFQLAYVRNLRGGDKNNSRTYALSRAGAGVNWEALRYVANISHALPSNWLFIGALAGQYSNEPLISGEQFGLGGVGSVRGFEERAVSGDRGNRLSLEVWAPPVSFVENMRVLGFIDGGHVKTVKPQPGQIKSETLISTGMGLRWRWKDQFNLQFDYGHELNDARAPDTGGVKTHFSFFYRF